MVQWTSQKLLPASTLDKLSSDRNQDWIELVISIVIKSERGTKFLP